MAHARLASRARNFRLTHYQSAPLSARRLRQNYPIILSLNGLPNLRQGVLIRRTFTLRNGMLNNRHGEASPRHVRIVEAKPELIVETLASGTAIDNLALPPVEAIPADEDTEAFRDALEGLNVTGPRSHYRARIGFDGGISSGGNDCQ